MSIKIYPSRLEGEPLEVHTIEKDITIYEWFCINVKGFKDSYYKDIEGDSSRVSLYVNNIQVVEIDWSNTTITPLDSVDIFVEPKAAVIPYIVAAVVGMLLMVAFKPSNKMPTTEQRASKKIGDSELASNMPKKGGVIPEIAGSPITYPDMITPTRSYFLNKREKWYTVLTCVGMGEYNINPSDIFIGDTPAILFGDNVEIKIYNPDEELSEEHSEWWHTPEEVGFTQFGTSGLTLLSTSDVESYWSNNFSFTGNTISSNDKIPDGWTTGMDVIVRPEQSVHFYSDYITSGMLDSLNVTTGDIIEVNGSVSNDGEYLVTNIDNADEEVPIKYFVDSLLIAGEDIAAVGYKGMRYTIEGLSDYTISVRPKDISVWEGWSIDVDGGDSSVTLVSNEVNWTGPFLAHPEAELIDCFEVDIFFPSGLIHYNKKGRIESIPASGEIQYRTIGAVDWISVPFSDHEATPDQLGRTIRVDLPEPSKVEVRVRRDPKLGWSNTSEDMQWTNLRGRVVGAPRTYPLFTTMFIKMRSGDKVSGAVENKVRVRASRILPSVEDINVKEQTRDIVPFLLHMLSTVGYTRDMVDMDSLVDLHNLWKRRQDTFDVSFDSSSTLKTATGYCLGAGWGEVTISNGKISVVRDAYQTTPPTRVFSPQEFTTQLVETTKSVMPDDVDGVDIDYVDYVSGKTLTEEYRLVTYVLENGEYVPKKELGERVKTIKAVGVTNRVMAYRQAARHRRELAFGRTTWSGSTELHAMNCRYLDHIGLQDGIIEYGQSAFVLGVSGDKIEVSEEFIFEDGGSYVIRFARKDGTTTPTNFVSSVTGNTVIVSGLQEDIPIGSSVYFGKVGSIYQQALITEVSPTNSNKVNFKARVYDPRIYEDDDYGLDNTYIATSQVYAPIPKTSVVYPLEDTSESEALSVSVKESPSTDIVEQSGSTGVAILGGQSSGTWKQTPEPEEMNATGWVDSITMTRTTNYSSMDAGVEQMNATGWVDSITMTRTTRYSDHIVEPQEMNATGWVNEIIMTRTSG